MAKIIKCTLSTLDDAIREIEAYERELSGKVKRLREAVAERIGEHAGAMFDGAVVDDMLNGTRYAEVSVSIDSQENITLVIANGEDAVFVEFGAGVYHNGSPGSSPHPEGARLGFTIGSYGDGHGKRKVWGYREDGDGPLILTHGAPASMPMYNAMKNVLDQVAEIAKEVFG